MLSVALHLGQTGSTFRRGEQYLDTAMLCTSTQMDHRYSNLHWMASHAVVIIVKKLESICNLYHLCIHVSNFVLESSPQSYLRLRHQISISMDFHPHWLNLGSSLDILDHRECWVKIEINLFSWCNLLPLSSTSPSPPRQGSRVGRVLCAISICMSSW